MAKVGAQRAAELTGVSKSTIQRAMKAGKLSFEIDANDRRLIDVSELERAFGLRPQGDAATTSHATGAVSIQPDYTAEMELEKARHELEVEKLRMELRMAQDQVDTANSQIEDLKVQRDLWQKQAQQILITSQYSQKQSDERITEFREREEARQRIIEQRRSGAPVQQRPQSTPAAKPAQAEKVQQPIQQTAQTQNQPAQVQPATSRVTPAQSQQPPVFRTVQTSNQNATAEKQSLFASLFGAKKKRG